MLCFATRASCAFHAQRVTCSMLRHVQQVTSRRELHNNREFSIMGLFCTMLSPTRLGRPVSALTLTRSMCVFVYLSTDCPRFLLSANLLLLDKRMRVGM